MAACVCFLRAQDVAIQQEMPIWGVGAPTVHLRLLILSILQACPRLLLAQGALRLGGVYEQEPVAHVTPVRTALHWQGKGAGAEGFCDWQRRAGVLPKGAWGREWKSELVFAF